MLVLFCEINTCIIKTKFIIIKKMFPIRKTLLYLKNIIHIFIIFKEIV